jgi:EAL domain-containing protein (putative c-di-GMP-specific phosphodiesterase class I)
MATTPTQTDNSKKHRACAAVAADRVLLVDDDAALRRVYARGLKDVGIEVETATSGEDACAALARARFDVVVSDINMPGMNGVELLRAVRARDLDLPVVLMTADPQVETAMKAVQYGALRYMVKPMSMRELERVIRHAALMRRMAALKRQALLQLGEKAAYPADIAGLEVSLERALAGMWMAYQPVVRWSTKSVHGYEALMRSSDPVLSHPQFVLETASRLDRLPEVGRRVRRLVAAKAQIAPAGSLLFVNLHPQDLLDEDLYAPDSPLAREAHRCILEITERGALEGTHDARACIARLRVMGFRIAVDDVGAGHAGLASIAQLEPEIVKLDISLIRNLDKEPIKRRLVGAMLDACQRMGMDVVAEGVETAAERDVIVDLGCDLMQGFLFAHPTPPFAVPVW